MIGPVDTTAFVKLYNGFVAMIKAQSPPTTKEIETLKALGIDLTHENPTKENSTPGQD
jgi:hypothetical protein